MGGVRLLLTEPRCKGTLQNHVTSAQVNSYMYYEIHFSLLSIL